MAAVCGDRGASSDADQRPLDRLVGFSILTETFKGADRLRREWRQRERDIARDQATHDVVMRVKAG